jgi:hypothetical protein
VSEPVIRGPLGSLREPSHINPDRLNWLLDTPRMADGCADLAKCLSKTLLHQRRSKNF